VGRVRLDLLRARLHLRVLGEDRSDLSDELGGRGTGLRRDRGLVELPVFVGQLLSGRGGATGERPTSEPEAGAELDRAGDAERLNGALDLHADVLADLEVLLRCRLLVDDPLSPARPFAGHEAQGVETRVWVGDREAEVRSTAETELDNLAV